MQRGVREGRTDSMLDPLLIDDTLLKNSVNLKETSTPKPVSNEAGKTLNTTGSAKANMISVNKSSNTSGRKGSGRKKSEVTMLSGFENMEVKDLEVTQSKLLENRNHSLMSVSEFL